MSNIDYESHSCAPECAEHPFSSGYDWSAAIRSVTPYDLTAAPETQASRVDIAEFITARLDEAEALVYREGTPPNGVIAWLTYCQPDGSMGYTTVAHGDGNGGPWIADGKVLPEPASVLVVHDPALMLRDIEAKRRVLDDYRITRDACRRMTGPELDTPGYRAMCAGRDAFRSACASLAKAWSDHADYEEWA